MILKETILICNHLPNSLVQEVMMMEKSLVMVPGPRNSDKNERSQYKPLLGLVSMSPRMVKLKIEFLELLFLRLQINLIGPYNKLETRLDLVLTTSLQSLEKELLLSLLDRSERSLSSEL